MDKEYRVALIALILQFIELAVGIFGIINSLTIISIITILLSFLTTIIIIILGYKLYSVILYVNFLEYLMHNNEHDFVLLPKIRMYLNSRKINNKIKIKCIDITYDITPNTDNPDEILGDMKITYLIKIENKSVPEQFDFVYGNDYSVFSPKVKYCYGIRQEYQTMSKNHNMSIAPYWRGALKHYSFALEKQYLPQDGDIEIKIEVECDKSFAFKKVPRDTIICMPMVFSKDIDKINHTINVRNFGEIKFYSDAYQISKNGLHYQRKAINCTRQHNQDNYSFASILYPNRIRGEKAYYFKIGTSESDVEIKD